MTTATWGTTVGTIFGAITTTASAVGGLVGTAASTVGMLDAYVQVKVKEQEASLFYDSADFEEKILERIGQERTNRQLELVKFTSKSEAHAKLFDSNMVELRKLQASRRAPASA